MESHSFCSVLLVVRGEKLWSYDSVKRSQEIPPGFCVPISSVVTYFTTSPNLFLRVRLEHKMWSLQLQPHTVMLCT